MEMNIFSSVFIQLFKFYNITFDMDFYNGKAPEMTHPKIVL